RLARRHARPGLPPRPRPPGPLRSRRRADRDPPEGVATVTEKLAIDGGPPSCPRYIYFGRPPLGDADVAEVVATMRSGWIGAGARTKRFEEELARFTGAPHGLALSSCTAALFLALELLGLGPGDEVITTPLTFAATANVVEHVGARLVLADIDEE